MMNLNPWETDGRSFGGFEAQLFGRAKTDVGIESLAPHDDAVIHSKRPSPQSRSPIGTIVQERDYSPTSSPQHIDTLFRPSYHSVEFHRSLSPLPSNNSSLNPSPTPTPRVIGLSPRSPKGLNPSFSVSPSALSNSLMGLSLNPNSNQSPRSLTPGSGSPLISPSRSPRVVVEDYRSPRVVSDDQFDLEMSLSADELHVPRGEPVMRTRRSGSLSALSPPTITLEPPSRPKHFGSAESLTGHYGTNHNNNNDDDDMDQPAYISTASPFLPATLSSENLGGYGSSQDYQQQAQQQQQQHTMNVENLPSNYGLEHQSSFGEHPHGEYPSRTLFVRNIHSSVDDEELRQVFGTIGPVTLPIRSMYTQCKHRGFVMISYYDLRDAKAAMHHLQGMVFHGRNLDIHYSIPKDNPSEKDQNQGTLVVFNLPPTITNEELILIFSEYGEVKEVRHTPNKKHHRFIEFYDIRHAEKAMKSLNKTEIKGKKIKIEPSRAGSPLVARKAHHQIQPQLPHHALSASAPPLSGGVIHGFDPREDDTQSRVLPPHSYGGASMYSGASSYGGVGGYDPLNNGPGGIDSQEYPLSPLDYISSNAGTSPTSLHLPQSYGGEGAPISEYSPRMSRYYASPPAVPRFSLPSASQQQQQQQQPTEPLWGRTGLPTSPIGSPGSLSPRSPRSPRGVTSPRLGVAQPAMIGNPMDTLGNSGVAGLVPPTSPTSGGALSKASRGRHRSDSGGDILQFTLDIDAVRMGAETRTTLMIKNIPNKYSQKMLLAAVDERHKGQYDFFYLPIDFKNKCNVGYAFINFIDCNHIVSFYEEFHGKKWEKFNSEKICAITFARIQGKLSLIAHFQNSSLMCEDRKCRPIIFHSDGPLMGEQERFPVSSAVRQRRKEERKATDPPLPPPKQGFLE